MARFTRERLERESRNRDKRNLDPFEYEADSGEVFVFKHPQSVHFSKLTEIGKGDIGETIKALLGEESYERFKVQPEVDGFLMEDLFAAYNQHYGFDQGE